MAEVRKRDEKRGDAQRSLQKGSRKTDISRFRTLASDRTSETRVPKPTSVLSSALSSLPEPTDGDDGETHHCAEEFCAGGPDEDDCIFEDSEASESARAADEIDIPAHRRPIRESQCDFAPRIRTWDHQAMLRALLAEEGSDFDWQGGSGGLDGAGPACEDLFPPLLQEADRQCAEAAAHVVLRIHPDANCQQDEGYYKEVALEEWEKSQGATQEPTLRRRLPGWPEDRPLDGSHSHAPRPGARDAKERAMAGSAAAALLRRTFRESERDSAPRVRKWEHQALLRALLAEEGSDLLVGSGDCRGAASSSEGLLPSLVQEADKHCADAAAHVVLRIHPAANCRQDEYREETLEEWEKSKGADGTSRPEEQASMAEAEPEIWRRLFGWPEGSSSGGDPAAILRLGGGEAHEKDMSRAAQTAGSAAVAILRRTFRESECDSAPRIRKWDHMKLLRALLAEEGGEPGWLVGSGDCHCVAPSGEDLFPPLVQEADQQCAEAVAHVVVRIHPAADFQQDEGQCREVKLEEWVKSQGEAEPTLRRLAGWPEGSPAGGDLAGDLRFGGGETPEGDMSQAPPMAGSAAVALRRSPASRASSSRSSGLSAADLRR